jgi:hypothetical protein
MKMLAILIFILVLKGLLAEEQGTEIEMKSEKKDTVEQTGARARQRANEIHYRW